jgi:hypothetical protein
MYRKSYYMIFKLVLFTGLVFISGCEMERSGKTGFLEGSISIGPICPVETDPPDPQCLPTAETYKAYPVGVWTTDGTRKIALINPALDGTYKTELASGNYLVILESKQNSIGSSNLPVEVSVIPENKTILNIVIDTGIR